MLAVIVYVALVLALRIVTRDDLALLPKGEKLARILHVLSLIHIFSLQRRYELSKRFECDFCTALSFKYALSSSCVSSRSAPTLSLIHI